MPSSDELLSYIADEVRGIRNSVDDLRQQLADDGRRVEHRLTKVEVRSGVLATIAGFIGGFFHGSIKG